MNHRKEFEMKKRISLIQMDVQRGEPDINYAHAVDLMERAMKDEPDILVLPEAVNVGFFPTPAERLAALADTEGVRTREIFGAFAAAHGVNIVAGSCAVKENEKIYNRSYVFDRKGEVIAHYDKVHGFSPAGEQNYFTGGNCTVHFALDGIPCSMVICYDIRFPELVRREVLEGVDLFFLPAAWPIERKDHWILLSRARAVENQMYLCAVNECGRTRRTKYGGHSLLISPWGEELCHLGEEEEIAMGEVDTEVLAEIRQRINVFHDRRPDVDYVK